MSLSKCALLVSICFFCVLPDIPQIVLAEDGKWSNWWEWGPCSASCGNGTRRRFRICNNPPRSDGGADCAGKAIQRQKCNAPVQCPVDGGWNDWTPWTLCSVTCGEGTRTRTRKCDFPKPAHGGKECEGDAEDTIKCVSSEQCPRDGQWSTWGEWSACSLTCGEGSTMSRLRTCTNPPPSPDGRFCAGTNKQNRVCRTPECGVNGHWSKWSEWSGCTVTCGVGVRARWRMCSNPAPQNGGLDCSRDEAGEKQELTCNGTVVFCPVDGGWSEWTEFGECNSENCASPNSVSYIIRGRSCSNPYPAHKGSMCQGRFLDAAACEVPLNCPVDGEWGEWSPWDCRSQRNAVTRLRMCNNPAPSNGGKKCPGERVETYLDEDDEYKLYCPNGAEGSGEEDEDIEDNEKKPGADEEDEEEYDEDFEDYDE